MTMDSGRRNSPTQRKTFRAAATLIATAALGASFATQAMAAAEHSLAGIRVFSSSSAVLKKFGSPDEVRVGQMTTGSAPVGGVGGASGAGGYPGAPGGGGGYPGAGGAGRGGLGGAGLAGGGGGSQSGGIGEGGSDNSESSSPGGLPGLPGGGGEFGAPSSGGGYPGGGGLSRGGSQSGMAVAQKNSVTWIYDRPDGGSLEFTMSSDGRVVQIHASGFKGAVRTDKGVALGMNLAQVQAKYGYPESEFIAGKILTTTYTERSHAAFQFYNGKLVGIIVAAVE